MILIASIAQSVNAKTLGLTALATMALTAFYAWAATGAFAAASTTTGVDYVADLVGPVKTELTLAIVAGLGLMVVLMALKAGTRLIRSFGR